MLSLDLGKISSRAEAESALTEKIQSEKVRGFILKNLQRTSVNTDHERAKSGPVFSWKLNAEWLLKNLDKITEGVERPVDYNHQITGFPVIFLKGGDSDYISSGDYKDIFKVFPAAEIIEVPGAGHWIHADKPEEVIKNLRKLL